ncbi:MAG: 16S rRNA (cytosine(1402)-N(4))-methyltransferase RsmH [Candidatus Omnitrophota bacterium]
MDAVKRYHIPVMLDEVLEYLNLSPGKIIVDATIGTGGHSRAILERISPGGRLIGIDRDKESLEVCRERLSYCAGPCTFVHENFINIDNVLKEQGIEKIDGVIFDLGISSFQLDDPQRGFSFNAEGPLDMRMDRDSYISAYDLINNLNEEELSVLLRNFGQERWHNRIANFLVKEREKHPIATTAELSDIVVKSLPYRFRHRHYRIHPATRTFQAVRIAVNRELETLEIALNKALPLLAKNARICVISFHSLEDRIAKITFRQAASAGIIEIITRKPLTSSLTQLRENPSARSAKLRVAQKL